MGTTLRTQNSIQEQIKSRLKLGNASYHLVQNLLSSSLLSKNMKIKLYRTIILPIVCYGCEIFSLILREERRLRVFENRVLRRIFGSKRDEVSEGGENYILRKSVISIPDKNFVRVIKCRRIRWLGYAAQMGARRVAYRVLVVNLRHGDQLEDRGVDGSIILTFWHRSFTFNSNKPPT